MWIEPILSSLSNLSVVAASVVAIIGINSWRREHTGKRKIELAEETLALFYQAADLVKIIRSPFSYTGEGNTRTRRSSESPEESEKLDRAFVAIERFEKHQEVFNKLFSLKFRFLVYFGRHTTTSFTELKKIVNRILSSANSLSRLWLDGGGRNSEIIEKKEKTIWDDGDDDEINKKLKEIIQTVEQICQKEIK